MPSRAELKKMARRAVHSAFAVPILFYRKGAATPLSLQKSLTARLHNRVVVDADTTGQGGAAVLDNNTRVLFNREELALAGVVPQEGDRVSFPDYNMTAVLGVKDTQNGPIVEKWSVQLAGRR